MIDMDCFMTAFDFVSRDEEPGENSLPTQPFPVFFCRVQGHR
jgi:hypothetical protein